MTTQRNRKRAWDKDWADQRTALDLDPNIKRHVLQVLLHEYHAKHPETAFYAVTAGDLAVEVGNISSYHG